MRQNHKPYTLSLLPYVQTQLKNRLAKPLEKQGLHAYQYSWFINWDGKLYFDIYFYSFSTQF